MPVKVIQDHIKHNNLKKPGVYIMYNKESNHIYVGKAKNLHARLSQYVKAKNHEKTHFIASRTEKIETIVTQTEDEALLLEEKLIKQYAPRYNVIFRDDKSYGYIGINTTHIAPSINVIRHHNKGKYKVFGPFPKSENLYHLLDIVRKVFKIRDCSDSNFSNRTRPCVLYDIGQCTAPCVNKVSKEDYNQQINNAVSFLQGDISKVITEYKNKMTVEAKSLNFEKAMELKKSIELIESIKTLSSSKKYKNIDVLGFARQENSAIISVLSIRNSIHFGIRNIKVENLSEYDLGEDIVTRFIDNFYHKNNALKPEIIAYSNSIDL